jgi:hypothetical protein
MIAFTFELSDCKVVIVTSEVKREFVDKDKDNAGLGTRARISSPA